MHAEISKLYSIIPIRFAQGIIRLTLPMVSESH